MKILVFSDSHGDRESMILAAEQERPGAIFHLGDCWRDAEELTYAFPDTPLYQVVGNCDWSMADYPTEKKVTLDGICFLLCHGHTYGVKTSLLAAGLKAEQDRLDAFLFGHTHKPLVDRRGRTLFLNPGSIGTGLRPTYGILTVEGNRLDGRTVFLDAPAAGK